MTTKDILNQMEKEFNRRVWTNKMDLYPSVRTLLESFGEEIEDEIKKHSASLPIDIERKGGHYCQGMHAGLDLAIDTVIQQRLKVKEIISSIGK